MRVSREQAAASRERILAAASKLFRERGLDGIGVADLMNNAGLTHGGFYGHFSSKEELMAEACARSLADSVQKWSRISRRPDDRPLAAIVKTYLSTRHRDDPGTGCAVAALGCDASRHGPSVRRAFTEGVCALINTLSGMVPGKTTAAKREKALAIYAGLIGALVLSRAVDDPKVSEEILQAVSASIASTSLVSRRDIPRVLEREACASRAAWKRGAKRSAQRSRMVLGR